MTLPHLIRANDPGVLVSSREIDYSKFVVVYWERYKEKVSGWMKDLQGGWDVVNSEEQVTRASFQLDKEPAAFKVEETYSVYIYIFFFPYWSLEGTMMLRHSDISDINDIKDISVSQALFHPDKMFQGE